MWADFRLLTETQKLPFLGGFFVFCEIGVLHTKLRIIIKIIRNIHKTFSYLNAAQRQKIAFLCLEYDIRGTLIGKFLRLF